MDETRPGASAWDAALTETHLCAQLFVAFALRPSFTQHPCVIAAVVVFKAGPQSAQAGAVGPSAKQSHRTPVARFPELLHSLGTNICQRISRKHEKRGKSIRPASSSSASLSYLVAFLEQLAEVM